MTPQELEAIGTESFGKAWKVWLANKLGRSPSVIHRWMSGGTIPKTAERRIRELAEEALAAKHDAKPGRE